ncbi:hypothetical protein [Sorangium sp. So ce307]
MLHLDHRDVERVQNRAFYLSKDPARNSAHDTVRNWFDAEDEEERILLATLAAFPRLHDVHAKSATPASLAICYVGHLLRTIRDEGGDYFGLADIEKMVDALAARFGVTALHEQLDDLFVGSDATLSETRWIKAVTELRALSRLHELGKLDSLGWPPPALGTSNTPPFDCRVASSGGPIPCDIKPASGSGFNLVRDALRPIVEAWSTKYHLGSVEYFIHYTGTVTQQALGPAIRQTAGMQQFANTLDGYSTLPLAAIPLVLDNTHFEVTLASPGSQHISGGMQPSSALVDSLLPTLTKHIQQKMKGAFANGNIPFLLCYVRLPGSGGGDLKAAHLYRDWFAAASMQAANLGAHSSLWLGVLLLDYVTGWPRSTCYFRQTAAWPAGATPVNLASALASQLELI